MAHDVFISYSTKDKARADAACHALEAQGIRCWIAPRDIQIGAEWSEQIIGAIDESRAIVLLFSSNANESAQVKRELTYAAERGTPILPLRIENVEPSRGFQYYLGAVHWLDALTPPLETHLERLAERARALLAADEAPGAGGRRTPQSPFAGEATTGRSDGTTRGGEEREADDRVLGREGAAADPGPILPQTVPTESGPGDQVRSRQAGTPPPRDQPPDRPDRPSAQDPGGGGGRRGAPRKLVVLGGLALLALVGLIAIVAALGSGPKAPDLVGQTEAEAEQSVGNDYDIYVSETRVADAPKDTIVDQEPAANEPAEPGSTISVVVSAGKPPNPGDIFEDDFSDPTSGWGEEKGPEDDPWVEEYASDGYRIYNPASETILQRLNEDAGTAIGDSIVEVDATVTGNVPEKDLTEWGLICRAQDYNNLYTFGVNIDGRPTIWKKIKDEWTELATGRASDAFRSGNATNRLRADCIGSNLILYINGRKVLEAEDSALTSGQVGLYVQEDGEPIEVLFDNFLVSSP